MCFHCRPDLGHAALHSAATTAPAAAGTPKLAPVSGSASRAPTDLVEQPGTSARARAADNGTRCDRHGTRLSFARSVVGKDHPLHLMLA